MEPKYQVWRETQVMRYERERERETRQAREERETHTHMLLIDILVACENEKHVTTQNSLQRLETCPFTKTDQHSLLHLQAPRHINHFVFHFHRDLFKHLFTCVHNWVPPPNPINNVCSLTGK